jgi:DNA primase
VGPEHRDVVQEVRARTDLVELVSGYLPLKRAGQSFVASCPFHEEKTPSFSVSPARQIFHCFGCGEKGTVFDFVMKMERVEFRDALRLLAERAGVRLDDRVPPSGPSAKDLLLRAQAWAQEHYRRAYASAAGAACREYVESRGITRETALEFDLAFAPPGWEFLAERARRSGVSEATLRAAGLVKPREGGQGVYDVFRNRLIFPIRDASGRIIAFGGRTLDGSPPKYLNSPETELFRKGRTLFGLDRLARHRRAEPLYVMEGYTDVLMAAQSGLEGAVATLGTALTPDQARLLSRYADQLILVYDGDAAGQGAMERGLRVLLQEGWLAIQVVSLEGGEDPADFFRARGPDGAEELRARARDLLEFLLDRTLGEADPTSVSDRRRAAEVLLDTARRIGDPVSRELVLGRIADALRLPVSVLREGRTPVPEAPGPAPARAAPAPAISSVLDRCQVEILEAVLNDPDLAVDPSWVPWLPDPLVRDVVLRLGAMKASGVRGVAELLDAVAEAEARLLLRTRLLPEEHGLDLKGQLEGAVKRLRTEHSQARLRRARLEAAGDAIDLRQVQREARFKKGAEVSRPAPEMDAPGTGGAE